MTTDATDGERAAGAVTGRRSAHDPGRRAEAVADAVREAGESVKRRELDEARRALDARGGLTDDQREAVEAMADAIVGRLLAAPTARLRSAVGRDPDAVDAAVRLFDLDAPAGRARAAADRPEVSGDDD